MTRGCAAINGGDGYGGGRRARRRGMAMMWAIVLVGFVGVAMAALMTLFADDLHRTRALATEGQERQILLAAEVVIQDALTHGRAVPESVPLPAALHEARCAVRPVGAADTGRREFAVEATLGETRLGETLVFTRVAEGWQLSAATLGSGGRRQKSVVSGQ